MFSIKLLALLLAISGSLCFAADDYVEGPNLFNGEWKHQCTKSIIKIIVEPNSSIFHISIKDTSKFSRTFNIYNIEWNGEELTFTVVCNETTFKTHHRMKILSECELINDITGDLKANTKWKKTVCQIQNYL